MKKQHAVGVISALALIMSVATPAFASGLNQETMPTMFISGDVSASVVLAAPAAEYANTIGGGTEQTIAEPGVRTADPGDQDCLASSSCWWVNPNNQEKMTVEGQTLNLNEDAFLMCTFARGTFLIDGAVEITFTAVPFHQWVFVMRGNEPGDGDLNVDVVVTEFDHGFMTCTNLPEGAMVSEDYVVQNVDNGYATQCGAIDHCTSSSIATYEHGAKIFAHVYQPSLGAVWESVESNVSAQQE